MSLSSRLSSPDKYKSRAGLPCPLGKLITELPEEDSKALVDALNAETTSEGWLSSSMIVGALRDEGYNVGQTAVQRHRRQMCRCFGSNPKV